MKRNNMISQITIQQSNQIILQSLSKSSRLITRIFVHCTAGWQYETKKELIAGFRARKWKNNGYHLWVDGQGLIHLITPLNGIANGVGGMNSNSLHISYAGGIAKDAKGKIIAVDNRTPAQKEALILGLTKLKSLHPKAVILGHRDISPDKNKNGKIDKWEYIKECPCFDAIPEYAMIK